MKHSPNWPEQAFVLGSALFEAVTFEEIEATWDDMEALGIAKPPYDRFDLLVPEAKVLSITDDTGTRTPADSGMELRLRYDAGRFEWRAKLNGHSFDLVDELLSILLAIPPERRRQTPEELQEEFHRSGSNLLKLLIVLLATRNAVKERKECKTLRLGIGSPERNRYTTTIRVGKVTEHAEPTAQGGHKRPHLRRGHIRRQHYGPNRELVKQIFIEPVFVNADEGWIAERTAYNVGVAH